jgi:hypothetical protein
MTKVETLEEMEEKMNLAKQRHSLDADFTSHAVRAKNWQQSTLLGQVGL